jgi:hypothetical protein
MLTEKEWKVWKNFCLNQIFSSIGSSTFIKLLSFPKTSQLRTPGITTQAVSFHGKSSIYTVTQNVIPNLD